MPTNKPDYAKRLKSMLLNRYGNTCNACLGVTCKNIDLEFAHIKPTRLSTIPRGRGRYDRLTDIKNNPDCYTLLGKYCHNLRDNP